MEKGENQMGRGRVKRIKHMVRARACVLVGLDLTWPWPLVKGSKSLVISSID